MQSKMAELSPQAKQRAYARADKGVLVFGDIMLDSYIEGSVSRISPEAAVPVLSNPSAERFSIGGAGNVAHNLQTLTNKVHLLSAVGALPTNNSKGNSSDILKDLISSVGISTEYLLSLNRRTTLKQRVLAGKQQLLRIDTEDSNDIDSAEESLVLETFSRAKQGIGAIVISDYAKGIFTKKIAAEIGEFARKESIPVLADVKLANLDKLSNVSVLKLNLSAASKLTGVVFDGEMSQVGLMAELIQQRFSAQVVITCRDRGMVIHNGKEAKHLLAPAREVFDVSGVGDTVTATLAHGLLRGLDLEESATLAIAAASIAVSHWGTVAVRLDEVETLLNRFIVPKTWGHEEWIVNNDYCGKKLVLHEGHCCSLHYHKDKDETFYIASGKVGFEMDGRLFILLPGDSLLIAPGTKHRFYGLELSEIFEFSTHHMEEDSYRDEISGTFDKSLFDGAPKYSELKI